MFVCVLLLFAVPFAAKAEPGQPSITTVNGTIHISAARVTMSDLERTVVVDVLARFDLMANTIANLQSQLLAVNATSQQAVSDLRVTVQQQATLIAQQTTQINTLKDQLAATNATANAVQQQLNTQFANLSGQLGATNTTTNSVQQQLNTLAGQLGATNATTNAVQQQLNTQFASLSSQLSATNATTNTVQQQLSVLTGQLGATNTTVNTVQQQLTTQFSTLSTQLGATNATANTVQQQLNALSSQVTSLNASTSSSLGALAANTTLLSGQVAGTITQLNASVVSQGAQLAALATNVSQYLTIAAANATYLTTATANATYLTQASAAARFQAINGTLRFADGTTQNTAAVTTLPPNLISNSFMNLVDGNNVPTGWSTYVFTTGATSASITIQAVSAYTQCFEGPYVAIKPANAAATCEAANDSSPFWFGVYNCGPRIGRGGLASGWGYLPGRILKVTGRRDANGHPTVLMARQYRALSDYVLVRGWIKIVTGSGVRFGSDYGIELSLTKNQTDMAPNGWYQMNEILPAQSQITNFNYLHAHIWTAYGTGVNGAGDFEFYLALPYVGMVGGLAHTWVPSIMDVIRDSQSGASSFAG